MKPTSVQARERCSTACRETIHRNIDSAIDAMHDLQAAFAKTEARAAAVRAESARIRADATALYARVCELDRLFDWRHCGLEGCTCRAAGVQHAA